MAPPLYMRITSGEVTALTCMRERDSSTSNLTLHHRTISFGIILTLSIPRRSIDSLTVEVCRKGGISTPPPTDRSPTHIAEWHWLTVLDSHRVRGEIHRVYCTVGPNKIIKSVEGRLGVGSSFLSFIYQSLGTTKNLHIGQLKSSETWFTVGRRGIVNSFMSYDLHTITTSTYSDKCTHLILRSIPTSSILKTRKFLLPALLTTAATIAALSATYLMLNWRPAGDYDACSISLQC